MDDFSADTGTLQEVARLNAQILRDLQAQNAELSRQGSLAGNLRPDAGRSSRSMPNAGTGDPLELQPLRGDDPFKLQPKVSTALTADKEHAFDRLLDNAINKRMTAYEWRNRVKPESDFTLSARTAGRAPREILELLQGGASIRSLHGIAESGAAIAQDLGYKKIAGSLENIATKIGGAVSGMAGMGLVAELFDTIYDAGRAQDKSPVAFSSAGRRRSEALDQITKTFGRDEAVGILETSAAQKERVAHMAILLQDLMLTRNKSAQNEFNPVAGTVLSTSARVQAFSEHTEELDKEANRMRAFLPSGTLQKIMGFQGYYKPLKSPSERIEDWIENIQGQPIEEMENQLREAHERYKNFKKHQAEADFVIARDPLAAMQWRHIEQTAKATEVWQARKKMDWNTY